MCIRRKDTELFNGEDSYLVEGWKHLLSKDREHYGYNTS